MWWVVAVTVLTGLPASATDAIRSLPPGYTAGSPVAVSITVTPNATTSAYAVEDSPPAGWTVSNVDNGGAWDTINGKVKWGPFFDNTPRTLSYQATPPAGTSGVKSFAGTASFDGVGIAIGGAGTISEAQVSRYSLTLASSPAAGGAVSASPAAGTDGKYPVGTVVTLTATANSGYVFSFWSGDAAGTSNSVQVTMNADRSVTANFTVAGGSSAIRSLPPGYTAGSPVAVSITVTPNATTSAYAVEDSPPAGWTVSNVDNGGAWDTINGKVKWGPFFDNTPRTLSYQATPPAGTSGVKSFAGTASFDGVGIAIGGAGTISEAQVSRYSLTLASSPAAGGAVSASPAAGTDGKYPVGTVVTLTATANSGYVFSFWSGDAAGTSNSVQVTMNADRSVTANFTVAGGSSAIRSLPPGYTAGSPVAVSITVTPNATTSAYAVEDSPPAGWTVSNVDNGGAWDTINGKVKWGPFFDNTPRTLSYQATPPAGTSGVKSFAGTASFDGVGIAIGGAGTISEAQVSRYSLTLASSPAAGGAVSASPAAGTDGKYPVGTVVTLTATANSGYVFSFWSGDAVGTSNSVQVTMNADRSVTANFTVGQSVLQAGVYNGLVRADIPLHQTSGFVTLSLSKKASFSGAMWYAGRKYPLRGRFDGEGEFRTTIYRRNLMPLNVTLVTTSVGAGTHITGDVREGVSVAGIVAHRAAYDAKRNPAPQAGRYTVISRVADENDSNIPQGFGCGILTVNRSGIVRVVMTLGDGTKIAQSAYLSEQATLPFYVVLYRGAGSVIGTMEFVDGDPARDVGATMKWFKLPNPGEKFYPAGFSTEAIFIAARYIVPPKGMRVLNLADQLNNARIIIGRGNLPLREVIVTIGRNNKVAVPANERISMRIAPGTGAFNGTFLDPTTGKKKTFTGSIYQKANIGDGLFKGNGAYGWIVLEPTTASNARVFQSALGHSGSRVDGTR